MNWYRAMLRNPRSMQARGAVSAPTTYVWGRRDPFLGRAAAERTARHVSGDYRFVEVDAGHWLPEREPELVAKEVLDRATGG